MVRERRAYTALEVENAEDWSPERHRHWYHRVFECIENSPASWLWIGCCPHVVGKHLDGRPQRELEALLDQLEDLQARSEAREQELNNKLTIALLRAEEAEADAEKRVELLAAEEERCQRLSAELAQMHRDAENAHKLHAAAEENRHSLSLELAQMHTDAESARALLAAEEERCKRLAVELAQAREDNKQMTELLLAEEQHRQHLSAELARKHGDAESAHKLLLAEKQHCQSLSTELAQIHGVARQTSELLAAEEERCERLSAELAQTREDNQQTVELLLAEQQHRQSLVAELARKHGDAERTGGLLAAAEQGCSSEGGSEPVSSPHREVQQNNSHPQANLWDSAQDIERPVTNRPAVLGTSGTSSEMDARFRDREEWQQLCSAATSNGWLISPEQVDKQEVIGKGSFGVTYLGTYNKQEVAVKCVRIEREMEATTFLRETSALARLRHPNIMAFIGAVIQPPRNCWLILEYLPGGSLAEWLYGRDGRGAPKRSMLEKVTMAFEIAKGMLALETAEPPILHRDLKPGNVLLDAAGRPKVADFGLCRQHLESEAYTYTAETGSYTYMSPEMMRGEIYGLPTDVYSFAILAVETFRQRPPYEELHATPMQVAHGAAYQDLRPAIPRDLPAGLRYLLEACWEDEPEARPSFSMIVSQLADTLSTLPKRRGLFS